MIDVVRTTHHIPAEIMEEILLNLPVKSLLRFSSASKSWNSIIHQPCFIKKYRGHERIILDKYDSLSLSTIFSDKPIEEEASNCPMRSKIKAYCDGLFCVQRFTKSPLFLWNPSIPSYLQLPNPFPDWDFQNLNFCYGLGYDAVSDDYKLLSIKEDREVMLYSSRSTSWREIQSFPKSSTLRIRCCFVHGTLHWLCKVKSDNYNVIVSFHLSTEEYGEVALPTGYSFPTHVSDVVDLFVLRGELCLSLKYYEESRFVLWVMEEYGVVESWTKKLEIDYDSVSGGFGDIGSMIPLHMCEYGQIVIYLGSNFVGEESGVILMNKNGETLARRSFGGRRVRGGPGGGVFVESLVSPAMWPGLA